MSDKPDDFERACAAFAAGANAALTKFSVRRGMLAALKEMREPSEAQLTAAGCLFTRRGDTEQAWRSMLDELIRQGEQQGPGAD